MTEDELRRADLIQPDTDRFNDIEMNQAGANRSDLTQPETNLIELTINRGS